jgi:DNA-binding MarR family transcriptional regulator
VALAEQKHLVDLRRSGVDARARLVSITPAGRQALRAALATWGRVQAGLTATMGLEAAEGLRLLARDGLPRRATLFVHERVGE